MPQLPAIYPPIIEPLIGVARKIVESGEPLASQAILGNLDTRQLRILPFLTGSSEDKDRSAESIRALALAIEADFVFLIMDAWGLPPHLVPRFEEILRAYGSIGASPHRVDIVSFTLETHHGIWVAQAPVIAKRQGGKTRTFGAPSFEHQTEVEGRFMGLLPQKYGPWTDDGALH